MDLPFFQFATTCERVIGGVDLDGLDNSRNPPIGNCGSVHFDKVWADK